LILVDTSVWVDHLRRGNARLVGLLDSASVLMHPFILGEVACGSLADRDAILQLLRDLPMSAVAEFDEMLAFVEGHRLWGKGIGYVDVHLLAAAALTHGATLWTRDKRLRQAARGLGCAFDEPGTH
jgi:predicted nucleic acid-binding protein